MLHVSLLPEDTISPSLSDSMLVVQPVLWIIRKSPNRGRSVLLWRPWPATDSPCLAAMFYVSTGMSSLLTTTRPWYSHASEQLPSSSRSGTTTGRASE